MYQYRFVWRVNPSVLASFVFVGRWLEFLVYRQHHAVYASLYAARKRQSTSGHKFLCIWHHGIYLIRIRGFGDDTRLDLVELGIALASGDYSQWLIVFEA